MAESINELKSYTEYNVSTPTSVFTIGFQYEYNVDQVNVYVDGVEATAAGYTITHDSHGTISLTPAVPTGVVRLVRETDIDTSAHTFSAGAKFTAGNMDENFQQIRHSQQEVRDGFSKLSTDTYEIIEGLDVALGLAQEAAQDAQDAAVIAQGAADTVNTIIVGDKVVAGNVLDASGKTQQEINSLLPTYADKSASLQVAINNSADGDTVNLSGKTYPSGIDVGSKHLVGTGYNTVINVPSSGYGIKSTRSLPTWNRYEIRNLTLKGTAKTGTGFTFDPLDEISGRRNLSYVFFSELDIGINKPSGNIGNTYSNCNFDQCNYGFKAVQNTGNLMHSGCDTFRDAQFSNIKKWAIDITNLSDGGGQVSIQDSIIQFCQGGGIRIDYGNTIPVCPIEIRNVWFEGVATSATVNRDGVDEIPREIKIINTPMAVIDGCYLKNIELINSTVIARACRVDNAAEFPSILVDNTSQLIAEDLYANGYVIDTVTVKSIATQKKATPNLLTMRGQPTKGITKKPYNSFSALGRTFSGTAGTTTFDIPGSLTVQASCVVDDGISGTCAELNLTSGITNVIGNHQLIAGKWAVWGISIKAVSGIAGTFKFKNEFDLGDLIMSEGKWVHNFGVAKVGVTGYVSAWFEPIQAGVIRFANYFVVQFDTEAEAIAFANSRMAVDTTVREVAVAWNPPLLDVNAIQTTTVTLMGARLGESVSVSFDMSLQGSLMWGAVTANDTVTIYHKNTNSVPVDLALGTLRVKLI